MAVVLAFRALLYLSPRGTVYINTAAGAGGAGTSAALAYVRGALATGNPTDAELSDGASAAAATVVQVTTFSEPFEVRRLQASFRHASATVSDEDVRVITFHLIKVAGGVPQANWIAADFDAARNAFLAFWTAIKTQYHPNITLVKTAFYRAGPGIDPPQPPVNSADHAVVGTSVQTSTLPPQVALTVTEQVSGNRKHWGRFYLPNMVAPTADGFGRPGSGTLTVIADAADTMYQAWLTANLPAVVYLPALPERSPDAEDERYRTKGTFPPRAAEARTVDQLQVDNVFDVIRSRRFDRPTLRVQRAIA